jgi:hypothetical protein
MKTYVRVLLIFVLPCIAPLLFPPDQLFGLQEAVLLGVTLGLVALVIGFFTWRGQSLALTFSIFLQGFNVITRLMMLFSTAVTRDARGQATVDYLFIVLSVLSIGLSLWLLLRLDRPDVRGTMVA